MTIILASTSPFRRMLLENAGVAFIACPADIDERAIEAGLGDAPPETVARRLAEEKALAVSRARPDDVVIGSDQTLSLENRIFHKPRDRAEAAGHLTAFSGRTHHLNSGLALARNGAILWSDTIIARMSVRVLSPAYIERYLDRVGEQVFRSVGAYQLEGEGVQLFERIEGDYFTVVGLPLLPLLRKLRDMGEIDG